MVDSLNTPSKILISKPQDMDVDILVPSQLNEESATNSTIMNPSVMSASTPVPAKVDKNDDIAEEEEDDDIIQFNVIPLSHETSTKLSNTSLMLKKLLGEIPIVLEFDSLRKNLKKIKSVLNINAYKDCVAKLEVKLYSVEEFLKKSMKDLELEIIKNSNSPTEMNKYNNTVDVRPLNENHKKTTKN